MATDIVYADGTLGTGNNDGTSWTDAHQGIIGLQAAFDAVNAANETLLRIRNTFTSFGGSEMDVDAAGGTKENNTWLRVIGYDADGVELTGGNYVLIDNSVSPGRHCMVINGIENIEFRHIEAKVLGQRAFSVTNANNIVLNQCADASQLSGFSIYAIGSDHLIVIGGAYISDFPPIYLAAGSTNCSIRGSHLKSIPSEGECRVVYAGFDDVSAGLSIDNCILVGNGEADSRAIHLDTDGMVKMTNSVIYNTNEGFLFDDEDAYAISLNNIFYLKDADSVVYKDLGTVNKGSLLYSDYSCAYSLAGALSAGLDTTFNHINADPLFVDAANDDFRLLPGSPCLNTGKPTPNSGYASMGAWQQKQGVFRGVKC